MTEARVLEAPRKSIDSRANPQFKISSSGANWFHYCHPQAVGWSAERFSRIVEQAGYDGGIQWHAFRSLSKYQLLYLGAPQGAKDAITSAHQSFVSEESPLSQKLILPDHECSLKQIGLLQKKLGRALPVVLYPELTTFIPVTQKFSEATFQPTPNIFKTWVISGLNDLIETSNIQGYKGLAVDFRHTDQKLDPGKGERFDLHPLINTFGLLLPYTQEVHIRIASEIDPERSMGELKLLMDGSDRSHTIRLLRQLKYYRFNNPTNNIRVVTEIPALAYKNLDDSSKRFISTENLISWHRRLTYIVDHILNTPRSNKRALQGN